MEEFDLDFLKTPPRENGHPERADSPFVFNDFDLKSVKNKYDCKRLEMPRTIAKVDELVREIDKMRSQNIQLQQQLRSFQAIAKQVEELYSKEKDEHDKCKSKLVQVQKEYNKIDVDLTNMSMLNGQLKARLADYDGRPINFDNLAIKYVKIVNKLEDHDVITHHLDKDLVEKLREYCLAMKLKIPRYNSPQKSRSRRTKVKTQEANVQCNLLQDSIKNKPDVKDQYTQYSNAELDQACRYNNMSSQCDLLITNSSTEDHCPTLKIQNKVQDQHTQCSTAQRDQASQYISTMITRQTNTEKIGQKNVQTMFPEPAAIDHILSVYSRWSNIRSVSPLLSPTRECNSPSKDVSKKFSTTGTCTLLCNIRRRIDYLNFSNSTNIKLETFTPSTSPTPISYPTTSRSVRSNVAGNINSSLLNLFNSSTNSPLEHLSSNAFNELWQIFGKMLLSLLQSSNTGIPNSNQYSPLNQQQFLDWLLDLYMNSHAQNTTTVQTQTLEERDVNISASPLFFNDTSTLSEHVMRPQPQKTLPEKNVARTNINENESTILSSNLIVNNNCNNQPRRDDRTSDCDSINRGTEEKEIISNINELHTRNTCEINLHKFHKTNISADQIKSNESPRNRNEIVEKIQELLPEIKLNKKKRTALKRLLKSKSRRKKELKLRKTKEYSKKSSVTILPNENYNEDTVETAVDFLKSFSATQENTHQVENLFSETEKIFLKQISNENVTNNVSNIFKLEEFAFVKPSSSTAHTQPISKINGDVLKCRKSKFNQKIEQMDQKYQLLFGESDSEFEEQEMEIQNYKFSNKPVKETSELLGSTHSMCDLKVPNSNENKKMDDFVENSPDYQQRILTQVKETESIKPSVENSLELTEPHPTFINKPPEKSLVAQTPAQIFFHNLNQEVSIPAVATPNSFEYAYIPEPFEWRNNENFEYNHLDASKQSLNPTTKPNCSPISNIEDSLAKDLELSSDCYSDKDDENVAKINEVPYSKGKLSKKNGLYNRIEHDNKKFEIFENNVEKDKSRIKQCITSVLHLNEYESFNNNRHMYMGEKRVESLPNLNQDHGFDERLNSHEILMNTEPMNSIDIEKDFELSSDNESVITENDLNDLHNLYSSTIEQPEEEKFYWAENPNIKLNERLGLYHPQDGKQNNFKESLKETKSEHPIESEGGSIFYEPNGKKYEILESIIGTERTHNNLATSSMILNNLAPPLTNEFQNDKRPTEENEENHQETTVMSTSKQGIYTKINVAKDILESSFKEFSAKNFREKINSQKLELKQAKDNSSNNSDVKPFQSKSINKLQGQSIFMPRSKFSNGSYNETFQNFIERRHLEGEKSLMATNFVCRKYSKISNRTSKISSGQLCHPPVTKSECINKSNTEGNSTAWSVITVSDSSSIDKKLNFNEMIPTSNKKSNSDNVVSKVPDKLALPSIDKIYNQKLFCNPMTNTNEIKAVIGVQDQANIHQNLKDQNAISSYYGPELLKAKPEENLNNDNTSEYQNISQINRKEQVVILSCSTITQPSNANNGKNIINGLTSHGYLTTPNRNTAEIAPTSINGVYMDHENNLNFQDKNGAHVLNGSLENLKVSNIEPCSNVSLSSVYTVDESDLNDNLSLENELMIDEELNTDVAKESKNDYLNSTILTEFEENCNDTTSSSDISSLLNSSLYNEVLTDSINPIVGDLLKDELITPSITPEVKQKRGRKRKSESQIEVQPSKRSQRIKAMQMILEESANLSTTSIKLGKYTRCSKNVNNDIPLKTTIKEVIKRKNIQLKNDGIDNNKLHENENENTLLLGFFREREDEEGMTTRNNETFAITKTEEHQKISNETFQISYEAEISCEGEQCVPASLEKENQNNTSSLECNNQDHCESDYLKNQTSNIALREPEKHTIPQNCCEPLENSIYSDSPQSPVPTEMSNGVTSESFVIIPLERPAHFMPQNDIRTLLDILIDSYKKENQKQVLESASAKEFKRTESISNKLCEEIKLYCYTEMELNLYCTSTSLINKLLSTSSDYNLIQNAVIKVAQNAEGTNTAESDFPSIIQEMPPRHLSKCLQRLFVFLKNIVTRNSNFCHDLIIKTESLLFSYKQTEKLSLQATLNLTQLYLMASKVQEYLQIPKHSARLFIAKCLYFYLQKSSLMIHEVLMWYPTVLPYREDKTYDRSDALISVIQHILMTTKYEMCKPELRGKVLLSKLRYEYHFEPFKPSAEEVVNILVEKLKSSKFYNISLAFGLLCKRMGVIKTQNIVLHQNLLPLANDYYSLALKTKEYDKRIAVLLEVISMLIKPLPIETDTQKYFCDFARFLNGFERQDIQEAALCSLLRLQRFNVEYCYNSLRHFQPTYKLNIHTQAMLKTFLYRRPLTFWKQLKSKNPKNFN